MNSRYFKLVLTLYQYIYNLQQQQQKINCNQ